MCILSWAIVSSTIFNAAHLTSNSLAVPFAHTQFYRMFASSFGSIEWHRLLSYTLISDSWWAYIVSSTDHNTSQTAETTLLPCPPPTLPSNSIYVIDIRQIFWRFHFVDMCTHLCMPFAVRMIKYHAKRQATKPKQPFGLYTKFFFGLHSFKCSPCPEQIQVFRRYLGLAHTRWTFFLGYALLDAAGDDKCCGF